MVDTSELGDRLEEVRLACKFPTAAAFTDALGEKRTQWGNWRKRGSIGRADVRIQELTGVDILWLKTGKGIPFPNGPIIFDGLPPASHEERLRDAEQWIDETGVVVSLLIRALSESAPDVLRALGPLLHSAKAKRSDSNAPVIEAAIDAVEKAVPAAARVGRRAAPPSPAGKR